MKSATFLLLLCSALFSVGQVWAYPSNFMGTRTGAPGEGTCGSCHGNLNTGPGSVSVSLSKSQYLPGETVEIAVSVKHTGQKRWGFELTALTAGNLIAGNIIVTDAVHTQDTLRSANNRQYIWQTATGTYANTLDSAKWNFQWTAPGTGVGPVTFYVCALAANNNNSTSGDYAYTATKSITENALDVSDGPGNHLPEGFELAQNFPNPFNPTTTIEYSLPERAFVAITVFNLLGENVRALKEGVESAGRHTAFWDGLDNYRLPAPSGIYYYRLKAKGFSQTKKMVLVK